MAFAGGGAGGGTEGWQEFPLICLPKRKGRNRPPTHPQSARPLHHHCGLLARVLIFFLFKIQFCFLYGFWGPLERAFGGGGVPNRASRLTPPYRQPLPRHGVVGWGVDRDELAGVWGGGIPRKDGKSRGRRLSAKKQIKTQSAVLSAGPREVPLAFGELGGLAEAEVSRGLELTLLKGRDCRLQACFRTGEKCTSPHVCLSPSPFPQQSKLFTSHLSGAER